ISWRNPTAEQRDWGLDTYVAALDEAVDAVREVASADDVSMMGSCSGGITAAAYLGTLGGRNMHKSKNMVLAVCVLDTATTGDSAFGSLVTPETMRAAKEASRLRGVLDGHDLARMFAWMRPNDLIWNYWVNNYLLGKEAPAFDILFWNADTRACRRACIRITSTSISPIPLSIRKSFRSTEPRLIWRRSRSTATSSPVSPITSRPGGRCIRLRRSWGMTRPSFFRTAGICRAF